MLLHGFPKVRQQMADKLYLVLMNKGDQMFEDEKNEEIQDFLLETDWMES